MITSSIGRIIAVILIFGVGFLFFFSILNQGNKNLEKAQKVKNLTPNDFLDQEYEVTEVWERSIERKNMPDSKQTYIYFKVKGKNFNFNLGAGMTDYGKESEVSSYLGKYLYSGAKVKVLANKEDIAQASEVGILRTVGNFFSGTNNEVEVYRLTVDDRVVFDQDIHTLPFSNRSFADIAVEGNLLWLILGAGALYGISCRIANFIQRRKENKL